MTPVIQIMFIISALLVTFCKLRNFDKEYKLKVDKTKLFTHGCVVFLLLLLFIVDFV